MAFVLQRRLGDRLDLIEHPGRRLRFGRGTNVEVRIDDFALEYEHAAIEEKDDGFYLRDLGTTLGTGVNGDRLDAGEDRKLEAGDRIEIGAEEVTVFFPKPGEPLRLDMEPMDEAGDPSTMIRTITASNHDLMAAVEKAKARQARETSAEAEAEDDAGKTVPRPPKGAGATDISESFIFGLLDDFDPTEAPTRPARYDVDEIEREHGPRAASPPSEPPASETPPAETPPGSPRTATPADRLPSEAEEEAEELVPAAAAPALETAPATSPETSPEASPEASPETPPAGGGAPPDRDEPEEVDYLAAYRLPGGLGAVWAASFLLLMVAAALGGGTAMLHTEALSPGPLGGEHETVEEITCASCHTPFLGVKEQSCVDCHERIHRHQAVLADAEPSCTHCHVSHRGGDALRLADANVCVECHGSLTTLEASTGLFADRITRFTEDHPELSIYVAPQERLRLDEARARKADPGGLRGFDHVHHLEKLPSSALRAVNDGEPLACTDCHRRDEDGKILKVEFERDCQGCHTLSIDPRFGNAETPHDEPTVVLGFLVGYYTSNRGLLNRTAGRLGARSLAFEERVSRVAERVAQRHFRDRCSTCHQMYRMPDGRLDVEPPRLTERWFPHAEFLHGPHLELAACEDCHETAPKSRDTADVLLPSLSSCQGCHRPPRPEDAGDTARLGRFGCRACHTYHAGPVEMNRPSMAPDTILETAGNS